MKASLAAFQENLAERGVEIIADPEERFEERGDEAEERHVVQTASSNRVQRRREEGTNSHRQ